MNGSTISFVGNLTRDFELRFTSGGKAWAKAGTAVSRRYKSGDEWTEDTTFFDLVIWDEMAEYAAESLKKGNRVLVVGRLDVRPWENDKGEKRQAIEVTVDEIGPSLRWATCRVERVERSSGNGSSRPAETAPAEAAPADMSL